jgi:hypothetical protein
VTFFWLVGRPAVFTIVALCEPWTMPVFFMSWICSPSDATFFMQASQNPLAPASRHGPQTGILQPRQVVTASDLAW